LYASRLAKTRVLWAIVARLLGEISKGSG
jgi:hypothetical protein